MRCSGCAAYHPAYLFSYDERKKASVDRVCIGRQGHFRVCEYITFNYDVAQGSASPSFETCSICKPPEVPHHDFTFCYVPDINIHFNVSFLHKDKVGVYSNHRVFKSCSRITMHQIKDVTKILTDFMSLHPPMVTCNHAGTTDFPFHLKRMLLKAIGSSANSWFQYSYSFNARSTCPFPGCGFNIILLVDRKTIRIITRHEVPVSYATSPDWLCALEPQSYLSNQDQLTRGVM